MTLRMTLCTLILVFYGASGALSQAVKKGGLQGSEQILLTPSLTRNAEIRDLSIHKVPEFGVSGGDTAITVIPAFPSRWTWAAACNVRTGKKSINFFMVDGWMYATTKMSTTYRLMHYQKDVTDRVSSNAYHLAFTRKRGIEEEIALFLVSPRTQVVRVEISGDLARRNRVLEYAMGENESKFVHLALLPEEHTTVTWSPARTQRRVIPLNDGWRFAKGDFPGAETREYDVSRWESVSLPHTWNAQDVFDTRNMKDDVDIFEMYHRGPCWYRKTFVLDSSFAGSHFLLDFLGANQVADVWLNGTPLGRHIGGYTGFRFDASKALSLNRPNFLAVRVDNSYDGTIPPLTADFDFYGGLYRDVQLLAVPPMRIEGLKITTPSVTAFDASVVVTVNLVNAGEDSDTVRVVTNIMNPYGEIVQTLRGTCWMAGRDSAIIEQRSRSIRNPLLWSPDRPFFYKISSTVMDSRGRVRDETGSLFGFRWFTFDSDKGFFLNGKHLKLRGVNYHQDYLGLGNAVPLRQKLEDLIHIKKMGANFVRLAHYPHHPYVLSMCDSLGLLVWEEIPVVNAVGGDAFGANAKRMLTEMIERDVNHPSIILWGLGNEFSMEFMPTESLPVQARLMRELHILAKTLDPYRPTAQAHNHVADRTISEVSDVQGRNRYFGWYEGTYEDFARSLDEEKRMYPNWKILISEYGAEAKYGYHVDTPREFDHSETYQLAFHEAYLKAIDERPWVAGGALWNMFDFGSHVKIGNIPRINQKGMMTADRKPKSVYYFYQSKWSKEPMVYIVSHTWTHRTGRKGDQQVVTVFSNCDSVQLFCNSVRIASAISGQKFSWLVPFVAGENSLSALGYKSGMVVKDEIGVFFREER